MGYRPHLYQREIHRESSMHRFGKTAVAVHQAIDAALKFNAAPEGRFAYVAPFLKQAKEIA